MERTPFPILEAKIAEKGITKKSIAEKMGIDAVTLSRKLSGKVEFTLKEIRNLHDLFPECSIEYLFMMKEQVSEKKIIPITLDDSEITASLETIEEKLDRLIEKANRLKSVLKERQKATD